MKKIQGLKLTADVISSIILMAESQKENPNINKAKVTKETKNLFILLYRLFQSEFKE